MSETKNIAAALVAALTDLTLVEKGRTAKAGSYSYDYASIEDVVKLTRPKLAEHGIVALTPIHAHEDELACTVILIHTSGERLEFGPFPFPHGKDAQATGSMVTYHRRYALVSALGMATGEDDDGAAAKPRERQTQRANGQPRPISPDNAQALVDRCEDAGVDVAEVVHLGTGGRTSDPREIRTDEIKNVKDALENLTPLEPEPAA